MNLVGHLVHFLWHGLSSWWVAILAELRRQHSSGPKLIHPTPSYDNAAACDDEEVAADACYDLEDDDEESIPPFDDFDYDSDNFGTTHYNHPERVELPDCTASTGCVSTDDLHPDEQLMADHYGQLIAQGWGSGYNHTHEVKLFPDVISVQAPVITAVLALIVLAAVCYFLIGLVLKDDYLGRFIGDISVDTSIDTSIENDGGDHGGDDHDNSTDVAPVLRELRTTPRKQVDLSRLPSSKDLSVVQDVSVLKYNGIPLNPIPHLSPEGDVENLINRSRVLEASPSLSPTEGKESPQSPTVQSSHPSADSSPGNLSRLSDELEQAANDYYPSSPIILDHDSGSLAMTLDSANDFAMEAITERVNSGYHGQFGDNDQLGPVKLLIKFAKVPRSRELNVTADVTRKRALQSAAIRTSDLFECPSELISLNSNLTNGLETCGTDYSTSTLQTCATDYSTPNLQTCETEYNNDEPIQYSKLFVDDYSDSLHDQTYNPPHTPNNTPVCDLVPLKCIDDYSESSNSGTLKNSNGENTPPQVPPPDLNENSNPLSGMNGDRSNTSPYSLHGHREPPKTAPLKSPSRIPVMSSPTKGQFARIFKSSPVPKMKGFIDKPSYKISDAVEHHFFNEDGQSTDGEEYLTGLFGLDPVINFDEEKIKALTTAEIDDLIDDFIGKETSQNWASRYDNLDLMIGHLRLHGPDEHYDYFQEKITEHLEDILLLVNTTRSKLTVKIVIFIRDLVFFGSDVALSNENFAILTHLLIPLTRSSQASRHIQNLTIKSLCLMLQSITTRSLLANFDLIFKCILCEKKMKGEKYACLMMLKFYILYNKDKLNTVEIKQIVEKLVPLIPELSVDAYQKTRTEVVEIYLILLRLGGDAEGDIGLDKYYSGLGSFLKSQVARPVSADGEDEYL